MEDDRDDGEDQQQMDEETSGVKDDETADPRQDENQRNDEKHTNPLRCLAPLLAEMRAADRGCPPQNIYADALRIAHP